MEENETRGECGLSTIMYGLSKDRTSEPCTVGGRISSFSEGPSPSSVPSTRFRPGSNGTES